MVDIQESSLATFKKHHCAVVQSPVQHQGCVGHVRPQGISEGEQVFRGFIHGDGFFVVHLDQLFVLADQGALNLLTQDLFVKQVLNANTESGHLVGIGRADAATCCTDLGCAQRSFGGLVQHHVIRSNQVSTGREKQLGRVHAALVEVRDFLQQHRWIHDDTVADDGDAFGGQDAGGQQVKGIFLVAYDDGVAGVVTALIAHDVVDRTAK
ncbi:unannotated protein [freshwater metagenome]|uniref:Unannotated protein n=1 Tax=freshwater metagenome TaxID=449393 RepID=A0A6J6W477_9ZZZZ